MSNNNEKCPVMELMTFVDMKKEKLPDGMYVEICKYLLQIKNHHTLLSKDVRRLKKKLFQRKLVADCVVDYVTDREYDSNDETIFIQFSDGY